MRTFRIHSRAVIGFLLLSLVILFLAAQTHAQSLPAAAPLSGVVNSAEGKPLEGVGVSARNASESFTTTVYTNGAGHFFFPPIHPGAYKIWAQAVGFEMVSVEIRLTEAEKKQLELKLPALADFHAQLSGTEWAASLSEETPNDRRMKSVFINNCSGCHEVSFPLQNRFDTAGWKAVVTLMQTMQSIGYAPEGQKNDPVVLAYKQELAEYLARVRGPGSPLIPKFLPRPTGEAAQIVVTEYDLPRPGQPDWVMKHNGTDWLEGTPSRYDGRAAHDVAIDQGGFVWFADDATPDRTLGKLDPRTGKVTDYKLADA